MKRFGLLLWLVVFASGSVWAATGFKYEFDDHTLGLWHFDEGSGNIVTDSSKTKLLGMQTQDGIKQRLVVLFVFDGQQSVYIPVDDEVAHQLLTPNNEITVKAWVYAQSLDG